MLPRIFGVLAALVCAGAAVADPKFDVIEVPEHVYAGGWEHFVGGGIASFDCNDDGLPELYAAGGENPALMLRNVTAGAGARLAFVADTPPELALRHVTGAYPLDFDNDAVMDLVVLRAGRNVALRGLGNCRFAATELMGASTR